jgi:hypothetical protein
MPFILILAIAAGLGWAWWTGRLKGLTAEDGIALVAFLLGLRFAGTGKPLIGLPLVAGATLWALYRRRRRGPFFFRRRACGASFSQSLAVEEARTLLGVDENASLAEIREAHRRLIVRVHPDAGGSAELAHKVNAARDTLVSEMNRNRPRAS